MNMLLVCVADTKQTPLADNFLWHHYLLQRGQLGQQLPR